MEGEVIPTREIVRITDELARYWRDHHLMDQLTVTRGYAELIQIDPINPSYRKKLNQSLQRLSDMAEQRGLRSITERIRNLGCDAALHTPLHQSISTS
jgi:hypothetical protein